MKAIAILLFFAVIIAVNPAWSTPSKVGVSAFAVNDYSNYYPDVSSLTRSILHKDAFLDSLFSSLNVHYPSITKYVAYNYENSSATVSNYKGAQLYHSEFVFFSGHGNQQKIGLYDYPMTVSEGCAGDTCNVTNYGKVYGGDIRWVIFDACLVLNVNQDNMLHLPLTLTTVDISRFNKILSVFRGVHAILGFYSLSWEDVVFESGSGTVILGSEDLYRYFVKYFIEDGENIWDAFNEANEDLYNEFDYVYMMQYGNHADGLSPAMFFLDGYDANGLYHNTSTETFDNTFNQPILIPVPPFTGSLQLGLMRYEHGSPEYY